jgi:hypothetical protein
MSQHGDISLITEAQEGIAQYRGVIDDALLDGLERYVRDRIRTGSFLRAVLENDFSEAIARAYLSLTLAQLKAINELLYNYFPKNSYGSPDIVKAWLARSEETERN